MKDASAPPVSIVDVLERHAETAPDRLACRFVGPDGAERARYTFGAFLARVRAVAAALARRPGLAPGDRVLLVYPQGLEMLVAFFACAHAGLVAVPVAPLTRQDRRSGLERIARVAQDCAAAAVLCARECRDELVAVPPDKGGAALAAAAALPWIATEDLPAEAAWTPRTTGPLLMLQYTSGSTNRPKGVMVSHANILANRDSFVDHPDPVAVTWLPQHHDMGLIANYLFPLLCGGTVHGMATATFIQRPALWLQMMSQTGATAASAPNFAFELCADPRRVPDGVVDGLDLRSLRYLVMAAEPVRPRTYQRFLARFERTGLDGSRLVAAYGLAENTLAVTNHGSGAESFDKQALAQGRALPVQQCHGISNATRLVRCGRPLPGTEVSIIDPVTHRPCPPGRVGEIWVRGTSTCAGYWNNPAATAAAFDASDAGGAEGFLRTGDLGFFHDGDLFVSGRIKDQIIVRGQNHFPQDIEAAAEESCAALRTGGTAAVSLPCPGEGEPRVVLVAEQRRRGKAPDPQALARAVRDRAGVRLDEVVLVPPRSIPKTTSGKTMHFEVARRLQDGGFEVLQQHALRQDEAAPAESLLEEIRRRYGLTGDEDFTLIDAGVDSLDLVVLMHELRDRITEMGGGGVAEQIDVATVQRVTVRDLFRLAEGFADDPAAHLHSLPGLLAALRDDRMAAEESQMRADVGLYAQLPALPRAGAPAETGTILLTGATGFLGPHLLDQFLRQTALPLVALVRGASDAEARERLACDAETHGLAETAQAIRDGQRVTVYQADLAQPRLGLDRPRWDALSADAGTICHNGAMVNYLQTYGGSRAVNVLGTLEALRLSREGRPKRFLHISTMLAFGWQVLDDALESDRNPDMEGVDFGYSQSKWVAEQLVHQAADDGQDVRVFRPAFLSPTTGGQGNGMDITLRLFAFMLKHGIGIDAINELSLLPVDIAARDMCAVGLAEAGAGRCFHVTRRDHLQMTDFMAEIQAQTGRRFELFSIKEFIPEVIRRCTREDPLFPLVDFFIQYADRLVDTQHKRYDRRGFTEVLAQALPGAPEPPLADTVAGLLAFLRRENQL